MRISDWSSDVCSSDLRAPHAWLKDGRSILDLFGKSFVLLNFATDNAADVQAMQAASEAVRMPFEVAALNDEPEAARAYAAKLDRKSGVSGKSVSVRVVLGGRRIIKKKKKI